MLCYHLTCSLLAVVVMMTPVLGIHNFICAQKLVVVRASLVPIEGSIVVLQLSIDKMMAIQKVTSNYLMIFSATNSFIFLLVVMAVFFCFYFIIFRDVVKSSK
jgi:hypothetical protein